MMGDLAIWWEMGQKKGAKKGAKNKLKIVFYNKLEGSVRSLKELAKLYAQNETGLENFRQTLDKEQFEYPQMKLLDMGFWQFGFDNITNNDE